MHHERTVTLSLRRCKRCCNATQSITTARPIVGKASNVAHLIVEILLPVCTMSAQHVMKLVARHTPARSVLIQSVCLLHSRSRARNLGGASHSTRAKQSCGSDRKSAGESCTKYFCDGGHLRDRALSLPQQADRFPSHCCRPPFTKNASCPSKYAICQ